MNTILASSAVGVVCIVLAMTLSLTSCQHGDNPTDHLTGANTAHKASEKDRLSSTASANNELIRHRQERQRKIDSVRPHPRTQQMVASMNELSLHVVWCLKIDLHKHDYMKLYELCNQKFDGESNVLWKALRNDTRMQNILGKNWINSIKDIARNTTLLVHMQICVTALFIEHAQNFVIDCTKGHGTYITHCAIVGNVKK